jgi:hypothetical protein
MEYRYRGHRGLHSLRNELGAITTELEKRRKRGHGATKGMIKDLRELSDNLLALQQEWYRADDSARPPRRLDGLRRKLGGD